MTRHARPKIPVRSPPPPAGSMLVSRPFVEEARRGQTPWSDSAFRTVAMLAAVRGFGGERDHSRASLIVQPKLHLGPADDAYEQEAERVAAQVTEGLSSGIGQIPRSVSRIQRLSKGGGTTGIPAEVEASIQQARGTGQPLVPGIRAPMERAFGADFSGVRVHADAQADQLNQSMHANAFTTGQDVFFRRGSYEPWSQPGQRLLAHELTHVVQQNHSVVRRTDGRFLPQLRQRTTPCVIQKARIVSQGPSSYTFVNSNQFFAKHHLAASRDGAKSASVKRANDGRGMTNTVLIGTEQAIRGLVGNQDYQRTEDIGHGQRAVPIECHYVTVECAHGADKVIARDASDIEFGLVWVKVHFTAVGPKREVSLVGIYRVGEWDE